jgi:carboxyl-terminal processing protease
MNDYLKKFRTTLAVSLLVLASFLAGVMSSEQGWVGVQPAKAQASGLELTIFWEAWRLIENRFVDREALDPVRLSYVALQALVEELGDTGHTRFLTPEQASQHASSIDGRFSGIGARLGVDDIGRPIVVKPFFGSPAQAAGLRAGDQLLEVDGEDVTGWTVNQIVDRVRGEAGTTVTLTVLHQGESDPQKIAIRRAEITVPALSWAFVPESKIAFIYLSQFSASANDEVVQAITEAKAQGATGLIIDVRGNPGGLLRQAVAVSSQFLSEGNVLVETDANGNRETFPVNEGGIAPDIPLVVLVDAGSASSSEIFAGALQDHKRGFVVGETTFGTGTVLTPYTLSDGSVLMLGTAEWLTADGRSIRKQGIVPDVAVRLPFDARPLSPEEIEYLTEDALSRSGDLQLLKAIDLLNGCWNAASCNEETRIR